MKKISIIPLFLLLVTSCGKNNLCDVHPKCEDLVFNSLAHSWDEAIPLGNAEIGTLVWQKDSSLRMALDHTDLWDLRQVDSLQGENFRFSWVKEHIRSGNYLPVQRKFDDPYIKESAPAKIPGAALEFPMHHFGKPNQVHLYLNDALCEVKWENGTILQTFVHATKPVGWFFFKNLKGEDAVEPVLKVPAYSLKPGETAPESNTLTLNLQPLGYTTGDVIRKGNTITYHQKGYKDYYYDVAITWDRVGDQLFGAWSITTSLNGDNAEEHVKSALSRGLEEDYASHSEFWNDYWNASKVSLPDSIIQKQYYNEMYKFGSATRENSSPISLQAVWTADNGLLPPWKGDYHHDLNTELSYWPTYTSNHLSEGLGFLNTLWSQRDTYKRFTKEFFEVDGMNVPGVATFTGNPLGGWMQYTLSQTISAWLSQHFYLHWKYSADREFLKNRAYPFAKDAAIYMEQISEINKEGFRTLEFSSSPEIFQNTLQAWFKNITNYDLGLMKFLFKATAEMADSLNLKDEATHWKEIEKQLPDYDLDKDNALTFSKGFPYNSSHRHLSHAISIYPLGLIDWSDGEQAQKIMKATVKKLEDFGPSLWTGYTYGWISNIYARMHEGEKAAQALRTFAEYYCTKNTFHVNLYQAKNNKKGIPSARPFTLEGNFAFAAGVQEMLLQSHRGVIQVFPAIPSDWKDVSFEKLRAIGAFLVSAKMENGVVNHLSIYSEKGGEVSILSPKTQKIVKVKMNAGETKVII